MDRLEPSDHHINLPPPVIPPPMIPTINDVNMTNNHSGVTPFFSAFSFFPATATNNAMSISTSATTSGSSSARDLQLEDVSAAERMDWDEILDGMDLSMLNPDGSFEISEEFGVIAEETPHVPIAVFPGPSAPFLPFTPPSDDFEMFGGIAEVAPQPKEVPQQLVAVEGPPALERLDDPSVVQSWEKWTTSPFELSYIDPEKEKELLQKNSGIFAQFAQHRAILYHSFLQSQADVLTKQLSAETDIRLLIQQISIDAKIEERSAFNSSWEAAFGVCRQTAEPKKNEKRPRVKRPKFSEYDVRLLEDWFDTHRTDPYPSGNEQKQMAELTGLSKYQVSRWFCNARLRRGRE